MTFEIVVDENAEPNVGVFFGASARTIQAIGLDLGNSNLAVRGDALCIRLLGSNEMNP
jgi:hypothetical protein